MIKSRQRIEVLDLIMESIHIAFNFCYLYLYKYENVYLFVCLFVCLFVQVFLGHFETDWDTLWDKVAFCPCEGSKVKILLIRDFIYQIISIYYIDLKRQNHDPCSQSSLGTLCTVSKLPPNNMKGRNSVIKTVVVAGGDDVKPCLRGIID